MENGPSLIARIGCDEKDFARGMHATEESMQASQEQAKVLAAQIALLEREMAGGKTDAMVERHTKLQASLRETQAEAKAAAKQLASLEAVKPAAAAGPAPADESARYRAWLQRADEQERSRQAHEAIANTRLAMPAASVPNAAITMAEEAAGATAGGFAISRMGKMELGHVARSLAGSAAAGMPIGRALEMEAPRLLSALGPALMGLLPTIAPLAVAFTGLAAVVSAHRANVEAEKLRGENSRVNSQLNSSTEGLDKQMAEETEQVKKTRHAERHRRWWNKLFNAGTNTEDVSREHLAKLRTMYRRDDAQKEDDELARREFNGDPTAAAERIRHEYRQKFDEIANAKPKDLDEQIAHAQKVRDLALDELARREAGARIQTDLETRILTIKSEGRNVAEQTAAAELEAAQKRLAAGPQQGDEYRANYNAVGAANLRLDEAGRDRRREDAGDARRRGEIEDRADGTETEATRARRAYREAIAKRDETKVGSRERTEADDEVRSAKLDMREARRNLAERAAQRRRAFELAGMTGPQSEQERARLAGEQKDLQEQLRPGSPTYERNEERRKDLEVRLAENGRDQHGLDRADQQRAFGRREQEIAARTGRGSAAQVQAIEERLALKADQLADNAANEKDVNVTSRLNAEVAQLKRQKDDILFAEKESLATLEQQGEAIRRHGYDLDAEGRKREIAGKYKPEIERAERDGDGAAARQLRGNQADEQFQAEVDDEAMSPDERAARARHNSDRARAEQRVRQRHKLHDGVAAANGSDFDARFHPRKVAVPERLSGIKDSMANAGRSETTATVDNAGIIGAVKECTEAVKGIGMRRAK